MPVTCQILIEHQSAKEVDLMCLTVNLDREDDGRWLAEISELPGVLAYGQTKDDAIAKVKSLSLRVLADRIEYGEPVPEMDELFSVPS
jgi:predicted RNase H-like HicB family nuclease